MWLTKLQSRITYDGYPIMCNYAESVGNAYRLRLIDEAMTKARQEIYRPNAKADKVAGDLLTNVTGNVGQVAGLKRASDIVSAARSKIAQMRAGNFNWGARTGLDRLDQYFSLVDGELVILAAAPSIGKTALARAIFYNRCVQIKEQGDNGQCVFFTADDSAEKFILDLATTLSFVPMSAIRNGTATEEQYTRFEDALAEIEELPLFIDETPSPTTEQMFYRASMLHAQKPIRLLGMDYLQLIKDPSAKSERQEVERAANGVKSIGRLGFPVVLCSQVRKSVENHADRMPTNSDLLYAGEAEANVLALLNRPEFYFDRGEEIVVANDLDRAGTMLVRIGKNKTGPTGIVRLGYRKETMQVWNGDFQVERTYLNEEEEDYIYDVSGDDFA